MRQAIIWANDGLFLWRIYASLGLNELKFAYCMQLEIYPSIRMGINIASER